MDLDSFSGGRSILRVGAALFFAALTGVVLSVNSFLNASRENAVIPLAFSVMYVVVSPVVLFFPLLMARRSMHRAAESELARIGSEYEEVTRRIGDPLAPSSPTAVLPLLQHQANLLQRHQLATSRLNAWPIGVPTAILAGLSVLGWIIGIASSIVTLRGVF